MRGYVGELTTHAVSIVNDLACEVLVQCAVGGVNMALLYTVVPYTVVPCTQEGNM